MPRRLKDRMCQWGSCRNEFDWRWSGLGAKKFCDEHMTIARKTREKQWYINNKERKNIDSRNYYQNNKEKMHDYAKQYNIDNAEKLKAYRKEYSRKYYLKRKAERLQNGNV
jgi:hypothetical protein